MEGPGDDATGAGRLEDGNELEVAGDDATDAADELKKRCGGKRGKCVQGKEAYEAIFKEHVKSATQFESTSCINSDRAAYQILARANAPLIGALWHEQKSMAFGKLFLKGLLQSTASHHATTWGFVAKDPPKWAADNIDNVSSMIQKIGRDLRQARVPKWVKELVGTSGLEGEEEEAANAFYVGWDPQEPKRAWRAPHDSPDAKEYTTEFKVSDDAGDLDFVIAVWGDWEHEIAGLTVGLYREQQAASSRDAKRGGTVRWRHEVDGNSVKLGKVMHDGKEFRTLLLTTAEMKEKQVLQVDTGIENCDGIAQKIAIAFLNGKIDGATFSPEKTALNDTRVALRRWRDELVGQAPKGAPDEEAPEGRPEVPSAAAPARKRPAAAPQPEAPNAKVAKSNKKRSAVAKESAITKKSAVADKSAVDVEPIDDEDDKDVDGDEFQFEEGEESEGLEEPDPDGKSIDADDDLPSMSFDMFLHGPPIERKG